MTLSRVRVVFERALICLSAVAAGCSTKGSAPTTDSIGSVRNADTENVLVEAPPPLDSAGDPQESNASPVGTVFKQQRFLIWMGTDSDHQVNIINAPLLTAAQVPGAAGGPPALASPEPSSSGGPGHIFVPSFDGPHQIRSGDRVDSSGGVAVAVFNGQLVYAFNGTDKKINIESSPDGTTWTKQTINNTDTEFAPALAVNDGSLIVAYTGTDKQLNVFSTQSGDFQGDATSAGDNKVVLGQQADGPPALASFNGKLMIGWTDDADPHRLNFAEVLGLGLSGLQSQVILDERSGTGPALFGFGDKLILSWTGLDNHRLNYAPLTASQIDDLLNSGAFFPELPSGTKVALAKTSDYAPTFADFGPVPGITPPGGTPGFEPRGAALLYTDRDDRSIVIYDNVFLFEAVCADGTNSTLDSDGDGLLDCWETQGIDADGDGVIDLDLPGKAASKFAKDVFLEVDFLDCTVAGSDCAPGDNHNHKPSAAAILAIQKAFAAGDTVENPDATTGVRLHVDLSTAEGVPHQTTCDIKCDSSSSCFRSTKDSFFGTLAERANPAALAAKKLVYRYALWSHNIPQAAPGVTTTGESCVCSTDMEVGLWTPTAGPGQNTPVQDSIIGMHELGHTLNLRHGGFEDLNFKPNYVSIMNYGYSQNGYGLVTTEDILGNPTAGFIDYSREELPALDETNLVESAGIKNTNGNAFAQYDCPSLLVQTTQLASGLIDWACDGSPAANHPNVANDINGDRICVIAGPSMSTLQTTTASGDDQFMGQTAEIDPNPPAALPVTPLVGDDFYCPATNATAVAGAQAICPGVNGILDSMVGYQKPDFLNVNTVITDGPDRVCQTSPVINAQSATSQDVLAPGRTVQVAGSDVSLQNSRCAAHPDPSSIAEENPLCGFSDWKNIVVDFKQCPAITGGASELGEKPEDAVLTGYLQRVQAVGHADLGVTGSTAFSATSTTSAATLTLTATNYGSGNTIAPAINLRLPAGASFTSCSVSGCRQTGSVVFVPVPPLASGESTNITVTTAIGCSVGSGTTVSFGAEIHDQPADPNTTNNLATVPLKVGQRLQDFTLLANNVLLVNDSAVVKTTSALPALIGDLGINPSGGALIDLNVGNNTSIGSILSAGQVNFGSFNKVSGSVTSGGAVILGLGNTIGGPVLQNQTVTLPPVAASIAFPASTGNMTVNPGASLTLAPGSYGTVTVSAAGHLTLTAGSYYFNQFTVQPLSTVSINKTAGPITINIKSGLTLLSPLSDTSSTPGSGLLVNYLPSAPQNFSLPFIGTLVAPNAGIILSAVPGGASHVGVFLGNSVTLTSRAIVTRQPFDAACK